MVEGAGKVIKSDPRLPAPDLPNLVELTKLRPEQYRMRVIPNCDDLTECYMAAYEEIQKCHQSWPSAEVIVDYTGGTKSMTAGLAAAALDDGNCRFQAVTGIRRDLVKVQDHTEQVFPVMVHRVHIQRYLRLASQVVALYEYGAAERILRDASRRFGSPDLQQKLLLGSSLCAALNAWDHFDHRAAWRTIQTIQDADADALKAAAKSLASDNKIKFELVEDLLNNAARRAAQNRYDDAIGRLYRALELAAQQYLFVCYKIDTSQVLPEQIPEKIRDEYQRKYCDPQGVIRVPLRAAWELIRQLGNDEVAALYGCYDSKIIDFLACRNNSLFAHGLTPIDQSTYEQKARVTIEFLEKFLEAIDKLAGAAAPKMSEPMRRRIPVPQLPNRLMLLDA